MMEAFYKDNHIKIYNKDCRAMEELPDESVQCVITSPPYWGLRKYSGEQELIWGDKDCEHQFDIDTLPRRNRGTLDIVDPDSKQATNFSSAYDATPMKMCSLSGAWKGQLGLEPEPDCGRPFMRLNDNLTDKQREYVMSELKRFGLI